MNKNLMALLQQRVANVAVGPSTIRGMWPKGTIRAAREFLKGLDLTRFKVRSETAYRKELDRLTAAFLKALPKGARHWGSARKMLNVFIRDVVYNAYLVKHYNLKKIEPWLELPLDSHVGKGLSHYDKDQTLPRWKTVIGLTPEQSKSYQDFAKVLAKQLKTSRVHLDIILWRGSIKVSDGAVFNLS